MQIVRVARNSEWRRRSALDAGQDGIITIEARYLFAKGGQCFADGFDGIGGQREAEIAEGDTWFVRWLNCTEFFRGYIADEITDELARREIVLTAELKRSRF